MMPSFDILDDIIGTLDPEDIPVEFITMAKVTYHNGDERVLRGAELNEFLQQPFEVAEVRVLLDVKAIRAAIVCAVSDVYSAIKSLG